jgi:hypothetical protein
VRRVRDELVEVVERRVVEGIARRAPQLRLGLLELLLAQLPLAREHLLLRRREHAVEAPQHRERQDDVLVPPAPEGIADEVRDPPDEVDDLAVVHG